MQRKYLSPRIEQTAKRHQKLKAIGNISYLGTIGDFIKKEPQTKAECVFVEKPTDEIQQILTMRLNSANQWYDLEGFEFSDESILDALQDADGEDRTEVSTST